MKTTPLGPRTVEAARALPEVTQSERWGAPLSGLPLDGEQIAWFSDTDGRAMEVIAHKDQWFKAELP